MGRVPAARGDRPARTHPRLVAPRHEPGRSSRLAAGAARRGTRGTVFDAELVALSSRDGRAVQDFAAVCRAALQADAAAAGKLHLVAFDLLELAGDDLRALPWVKRTELLREAFPASDRLRLVQAHRPAAPPTISSSSSGSRARCSSGPGRRIAPAARPPGASTRPAIAPPPRCAALRLGRDGHTYAISDLDGRRVTTLGSPQLAALIGQQVELAYSRIDADGSLREVRISAVDAAHA